MTDSTTVVSHDDDIFVDVGARTSGGSGADPGRTAPTGDNQPFPRLGERIGAWWGRVVDRVAEDPGRAAEAALSFAVVAVGTALVLATLHPTNLFSDSTPTGGDMGAHVWGPRYLLDELIPNLRLSGWSPDWYDGFPAYQFYMVVPSLFIVALHVGLVWWLAIPAVLGSIAVGLQGWIRPRLYPYRFVIAAAAAVAVTLAVPMSYNRSFKLVTAIGLLAIPVACWAFARLADLPFPIPPLASVGGLLFIYNQEPLYNNTGNIIGGNFQSTMAGEFAFSISLTLAVLYLGVAARGLRTGKHRALAAALFALAGLCHLIPAFFVLACTAALFLIHPDKARLKWLATMVPVAGLLTAFWVLPFWWRRDFVNDMGWEKLPAPGANASAQAMTLAGDQESVWYYIWPSGMRWLLVAAVVGVIVSFVRRYRVGMVLSIAWAGSMVGFAVLPQYRLWNARILPFEYLSVALLAAIGLGEVARLAGGLASGRAERPLRPVTVTVGVLAALGVLLYVALPLSGILEGPGAPIAREAVTVASGDGTATETRTRSSVGWRDVPLLGRDLTFDTTAANPVAGWSGWNYAGLEAKQAQPAGCDAEGATTPCTSGGWPEYRDLMATMASLGGDEDNGCGRAFWEYDGDRINGYGTPMAPMLLPYWTDGCIGSQEGLYFESSTTVPYHFLMQAELSTKPSSPQRFLPYPGFDIDAGVGHLQLLGVKYYLAVTPQAVGAAAGHDDLTEVAVSGPWHVYRVADAPLVSPLAYEPVVAEGLGESQDEWLPTASAWFLDPDRIDVPLAADGPDDWERVETRPVAEDWRLAVRYARDQLGLTGPIDQVPVDSRTELPAIKVTDIRQSNDAMSFTVSEPGVPVLVKASYFPNWEVSGADGPYRVTPNLMVVIPRQADVSMTFGRTSVDLVGIALTVLGLIGLVVLARTRAPELVPHASGRLSAWIDRVVTIGPADRRPVGDEQPSDGEPGDELPRDGESGNELPRDGEPRDGEPSDGEPGDELPRDDESGDELPRDGEPRDGEPYPEWAAPAGWAPPADEVRPPDRPRSGPEGP